MSIYRTKDLMAAFGVSRATINRYRNKGVIPPPDIANGTNPMWYRSTVEKFLPSQTTNPSV